MSTTLIYLLIIGASIMVAGGVIAFFALRNAPEGFENEEGFIGATKGDEALLNEFATRQRYSSIRTPTEFAA